MNSTGEFQRMLESWKLGREIFFFREFSLGKKNWKQIFEAELGYERSDGFMACGLSLCGKNNVNKQVCKILKIEFFHFLFCLVCFSYKRCLYGQESHFQCVSSWVGKLLGARNNNCERGRRKGSIFLLPLCQPSSSTRGGGEMVVF